MARTLGLDLGSYSLKAVWIEGVRKALVPRAFAQVRLPPISEGNPDGNARMQTALAELLASQSIPVDQVVIALPGPSVATHLLTLPFVDSKKIAATLPFELESQLPFDLTEAVYDYQVDSSKGSKSELIVGLLRKTELQSLLALLQASNVDPRIVTHPALSLWNLWKTNVPALASGETEPAIALVDLGHERTNVCIGRSSTGVEYARTFSAGGKVLTQILAKEFQMPWEEAERWKESHGAVGDAMGFGPDAERSAAACQRGLQVILRELRPTLKAYAARSHTPIGKIILCGGTSLLKGLEHQWTQDLGIETTLLKLDSDAAPVLEESLQPVLGQAYALAARGESHGPKSQRFNLRRGEFGFKGDLDYVKEKVPQLVIFGGLLVLLLFATGFIRNQVLAHRQQLLEAKFCEISQRVLGKCDANHAKALQILAGQDNPIAAIPKGSAVTSLAELVEKLPTDLQIRIDRVLVDLDRMTLRCETDSNKSVDAITTAIKKHKCFQDVQEGKLEKSADGSKVLFSLDIKIQCPDDPTPQG